MANKIYNLYIKTGKALNIILTDFTTSASWIISLTNKITLSFVVQETKRMITSISQKSSLATTILKMIVYSTSSMSEKNVANINMSMKIYATITKSAISFANFILHERTTGSSSLSHKSTIVFSPILALFYKLSTWDVETLSTLDTKTLEEMDYSVV